jgi:hypothetical protein
MDYLRKRFVTDIQRSLAIGGKVIFLTARNTNSPLHQDRSVPSLLRPATVPGFSI